MTLENIIESIKLLTVKVKTDKESGTGVLFLQKNKAYILTVYHCIYGKEIDTHEVKNENIFFKFNSKICEDEINPLNFKAYNKNIVLLEVNINKIKSNFIPELLLLDRVFLGKDYHLRGYPKGLTHGHPFEAQCKDKNLGGITFSIRIDGLTEDTSGDDIIDSITGLSGSGVFLCEHNQLYLVGLLNSLVNNGGLFNLGYGIRLVNLYNSNIEFSELTKPSIDLEVLPSDTTYHALTPLPPKNSDFIGRRDELKKIKKHLNKDSMVYVVNGIGGVGKSELSYQYLHLNKHRYKNIAFLEFTEEVSSLEDLLFSKFQDALLLDKDSTFDTIIKRLQSLPPRNLLVLDNIENPDDFEKLKVLNINFDLLITTRIKLDIRNQLNLDTLAYPDAKKLFLNIYNIKSDISDILIYLDKHPLFINLIAKSLKEEYIELDELRENIKNNTIAKIDSQDDKTFQEHLQDTFTRQFTKEPNNELKELLQILALFPSIEIDFTILKKYINTTRLKPKLQKLVARGWLSKKENSYKLHQIIKTFILEEYPVKYERITLIFMVEKENISDVYISILESFLKYFQDIDDEYITKILDVLTSFYTNLMLYRKALVFQTKSMEMKEKLFGKKSECTANSYNIIGELYVYLDKFEKALDYLDRALLIRKELFGENHLDVADSYKSLAFYYRVKANREKISLPWTDYTKFLQNQINNPKLIASTNSLENLGILDTGIDKQMSEVLKLTNHMSDSSSEIFTKLLPLYEKSLELNQKALKIQKNIVTIDSVVITKSYVSIARSYKSMGDNEKALLFYTKFLENQEDILEKDYLDIADVYQDLSDIYSNLGDFEKALEFSEKSLNILQENLGKNHIKTIIGSFLKAKIYMQMGEQEFFYIIVTQIMIKFQIILPILKELNVFPNEIILTMEKALASSKNVLSDEKTLLLEENLEENIFYTKAYSHFQKGEYDKAIVNFKKSIKLNPKNATTYNNIGFIYKRMHKKSEAIKYYKKSIEISSKLVLPYINMVIVEEEDIAIEYMKKAIKIESMIYKEIMEVGFLVREDREKIIDIVDKVLGENNWIKAVLGLWNGENEESYTLFQNSISLIEDDEILDYLTLLISNREYSLLKKIFDDKKLNLQSRFIDVYYAFIYSKDDKYPIGYEKEDEDLKQRVSLLLERV